MAKRTYSIGDTVKMTADALENYGAKYADQVFTIEQWYDRYGKSGTYLSAHSHPGYDGATGDCLYHLEGLNFDLYDWELRPVETKWKL